VLPAPSRHFYGEQTQAQLQRFEERLRAVESPSSPAANLTVVFGHYPTNSIVTSHSHSWLGWLVDPASWLVAAARSPAAEADASQRLPADVMGRNRVAAYLCGHLHRFLSESLPVRFGNHLYGRHEGGTCARRQMLVDRRRHPLHVMSCRVVSCRVVSCRVVSCRVVSCRVARPVRHAGAGARGLQESAQVPRTSD
jgi:hypothetical protein